MFLHEQKSIGYYLLTQQLPPRRDQEIDADGMGSPAS